MGRETGRETEQFKMTPIFVASKTGLLVPLINLRYNEREGPLFPPLPPKAEQEP